MSTKACRAAVRSAFNSLVAAPLGLQTYYDNEPDENRPNAVHFLVEVITEDGEQVSMGGQGVRRFRVDGQLRVRVYAPLNVGESALETAFDAIETAFRGKTIGGVVYRSPITRRRGRVDRWWQATTSVPFYFDFFA